MQNSHRLWYQLLSYLEADEGQYINEIREAEEGTDYYKIKNNADITSDFFDAIYSDMVAAIATWDILPTGVDSTLLEKWENHPWNESMAKLFYQYYKSSRTLIDSEDGWLVETENNQINNEWLKSDINAESRIGMRTLDMKYADAGNSFVEYDKIYEYKKYLASYKVIITHEISAVRTEEDVNLSEVRKVRQLKKPITFHVFRKDFLEIDQNLYLKWFNNNDISKFSDIMNNIKQHIELPVPSVGDFKDKAELGWRDGDIRGGEDYLEINPNGWFIRDLPSTYIDGDIEEIKQYDKNSYSYYYYGKVIEEPIYLKTVVNSWVVPWYNMDGNNYKYVRGFDLKESVMRWGTNEEEDKGKFFLDFTHRHNTSFETYKWTRLLLPQNKRRVEIEDLNRNFWVIGQVIASITAYLFDQDGSYPSMIGNLLNEIMQLWENVLFMWGEIAMSTNISPDIATEFVYIELSDLIRPDSLYYDNIESDIPSQEDFILEILKEDAGASINNKIHYLKKNKAMEQLIVSKLRKYHKNKYDGQNVFLIPLLRLNNYDNNYYSRLICPGYYRYQKDYEQYQKYYQNQFNGEIIPVEIIDDVAYADAFSEDGVANHTDISLSTCKESFFAFTYSKEIEDSIIDYYAFDFSIGYDEEKEPTDFTPFISGIYEYKDESRYGGVNYFKLGKQIRTPNEEEIYGILFPRFRTEVYNRGKLGTFLSLYIDIYDLAKYFLETPSLIVDNAEQMGKYNVYWAQYSWNLNMISYPSGIVEIRDIRRYNNVEEEPIVVELNPSITDFGYYLGDVISNRVKSRRIKYDLKAFKNQELRPSNYPDLVSYKEQYGKNNADAIIINDMANDKAALTNFLTNAYDWWYSNYITNTFWTSQRKRGWTNNTKEVSLVAYDSPNNGAAIIKSRQIVPLSYDNLELKWNDTDEQTAIEQWQSDCQKEIVLPKSKKEMSSTTILFAAGHRSIDYQAERGPVNGYNFIASDGLVHHAYGSTSTKHVVVGAAMRMPLLNGDAVLAYYPLHITPTAANKNYNTNFSHGNEWTWRSPLYATPLKIFSNMINDYVDDTDSSYASLVEDYENKTLYLQVGDTYRYRFDCRVNSSGGSGRTQYLIMQREGEEEITPDNWRVCQINEDIASNIRYAEITNSSNLSLNDENYHEILLKTVAPGKESSVFDIGVEYDAFLFRKYIMNYVSKKYPTEASWYTNQVTIASLYEELNLDTLLFGWLDIVDLTNNVTYKIRYNYDSPFNYKFLTKEEQEIIRTVRTSIYSNTIEEDLLWNFIEILPAEDWINGIKPNQEIREANYYRMGRFNGIYQGSVNLPNELRTEQYWYEDRILDMGAEFAGLLQMRMLSQNSNYVDEWRQDVSNILNANSNSWYLGNGTMQDCASKLEKFVYPLEGNYPNNGTVELSISEGQVLSISYKIFFKSEMTTGEQIYVFGPENEFGESLYARRGIYRYSLTLNGITGVEINNNDLGKWPIRPANLQNNDATNWKDDYSFTGSTVDDLRDGYEVIYVIDDEITDYEKYKTHGTIAADGRAIPSGRAAADDLDFNNIQINWREDDE